MKNSRIYYFIFLIGVIFLGLFSRKIPQIPLWLGDFLYAIMIYLLIRMVFIYKKAFQIMVISLAICYTIEFLQLYQGNWMIELRKTLFGRYVLGQEFIWTDLVAYTFGIITIFSIEKNHLKPKYL
ncbi:hypothetical protein Flavo103_14170 [Flavobacterium collinsii]|nr:hypothetical protein Flavo103_14170 [Flavobacterium collinsii]